MVAPSRGIYLHFKIVVTIFYCIETIIKLYVSINLDYFQCCRLLSAHELDLVFAFFLTFTNFPNRYYLLSISPAGPAAALAALQRPSVATVGAAVAAARAAPGGPPTPVGGVLVAGSLTALGRRQLAG
jgi:hypothetical protein